MLSRLIYTSKRACLDDSLSGILEDSRGFNARNDLSGALYLFDDLFIQYLEGEESMLDALYGRIRQDPRHEDCCLLDKQLVMLRLFRGWSMAWLVRTPETDQLMEILLPQPMRSPRAKGSSAASLFQAFAKAAEHR